MHRAELLLDPLHALLLFSGLDTQSRFSARLVYIGKCWCWTPTVCVLWLAGSKLKGMLEVGRTTHFLGFFTGKQNVSETMPFGENSHSPKFQADISNSF